MKIENLQAIKRLFEKNKILTMSGICTSFEGTSMRTIIRYLNEIGYYSSYNRAGKYYTIAGIPTFDDHGLWGYREALFSTHGNLKETIRAQTDVSEAGMTSDELAALLHVSAKSTLAIMAADGDIARSKDHGVYTYFSNDPVRREKQLARRHEMGRLPEAYAGLDPYDIVGVLAIYIKGIRTPGKAAAHLRDKGHNVSRSVAEAIYERFGLEHDAGGKKNTI